MRTFTLQQLKAVKSSPRLSKREAMLVATAEAAVVERERLATDLQAIHANLDQLEFARPDREKVLVTIQADGWVEVYAGKWVDVRVAHFPAIVHRCNENLAEEIVEAQLPAVYRDLFLPGNIQNTGSYKFCPTLQELVEWQQLEQALDALENLFKGEPTNGVRTNPDRRSRRTSDQPSQDDQMSRDGHGSRDGRKAKRSVGRRWRNRTSGD